MNAAAEPESPRQSRRYSAAIFLLAIISGVDDVFSFVALGGVFTSVMTGNLVLWGLAVGRADLLAVVTPLVSITAFVAGVFAAAVWLRQTSGGSEGPWPRRVTVVLSYGLIAHSAVLVGWLATDGEPGSAPRFVMLALLASAMGIQSAAVNVISVPGTATTYFTRTLTNLVAEAATAGPPATMRRQLMVLVAVFAGAALAGVLTWWARLLVPILTVGAMSAALLLTVRRGGRAGSKGRTRRPGSTRP